MDINMNELIKERLLKLSQDDRARIFLETEKIAQSKNMQIGGKYLPFIHVPYIVEKKTINQNLNKLDIVISTLNKLENFSLSSNGRPIYDRLMNSLTPGGRYLVKQAKYESDYSLDHRHRRVDGYLFSNDQIKIIEVNQAAPLATSFYDTCQDISKYVLEELEIEHQVNHVHPHILEWFIGEYQTRFKGKFPKVIALPIEHGYEPKFSDLPNMAKRVEKLALDKYGEKIEVVLCFPYDISLKNGSAYVSNKKIDMIWRNTVYMKSYRDEDKDINDYETILNNPEDHLIINSSRAWLTRNKETFAVMWDDKCMSGLNMTNEELQTLRSFLPETHNLFHNQLKWTDILEDKENWISKPSDAGFGAGVEFGSNHSKDSWLKLMEYRASEAGYVFQRKVPYPRQNVLDLTQSGDLIERLVESDYCPHHINGKFTGTALSRANIVGASEKELKMNLVSGGHMLPILTQ